MVEFMDLPLDIINLFLDELSQPKVTDRRLWFDSSRPDVIPSRYLASPAKDPWPDVAPEDRLAMAVLSRTCQQLHQTVEPFLYRYVNVQEVHPRRIRSLVKHLSCRPDTAASIRVLHVGSRHVEQAINEENEATNEEDQVTHEEDQVTHEEDQVTHEEDQVTHEEDQVTHEEDQVTYEEENVAFFSDLSRRLGIGGFGRVLMTAGMWEGFLLFQARNLSALGIYETSFQQFQCSYANENDLSFHGSAQSPIYYCNALPNYLTTRCISLGFPSLESVELAGFIDSTSYRDPRPPQIDWAKITSIDLSCSSFSASKISDILATAEGINEFRVDQFLGRREYGPWIPFDELKRHARTLKSLTWGVEDYPAPGAISGFRSLSAFSALEFLTVEAAAIASAAHVILTSLPGSLRRLAVKVYIGDNEEAFKALAEQTARGLLPNLKEVVIDRWATHWAVFHDDDDSYMHHLRWKMQSPFDYHVGPAEEGVDPVNGFEREACEECELGWSIYRMLSEAGLSVGVSTSRRLE